MAAYGMLVKPVPVPANTFCKLVKDNGRVSFVSANVPNMFVAILPQLVRLAEPTCARKARLDAVTKFVMVMFRLLETADKFPPTTLIATALLAAETLTAPMAAFSTFEALLSWVTVTAEVAVLDTSTRFAAVFVARFDTVVRFAAVALVASEFDTVVRFTVLLTVKLDTKVRLTVARAATLLALFTAVVSVLVYPSTLVWISDQLVKLADAVCN